MVCSALSTFLFFVACCFFYRFENKKKDFFAIFEGNGLRFFPFQPIQCAGEGESLPGQKVPFFICKSSIFRVN
jgi:hypothetical protein